MFLLIQICTIIVVQWNTVGALQGLSNINTGNMDRRSLLVQTLPTIIAGTTFATNNLPVFASDNKFVKIPNDIFKVFQVIPDDSPALNPNLLSLTPISFIETVSKSGGTVWLGEHHNSQSDHTLQYQILQQIYQYRTVNTKKNANNNQKIAIGLEQVQKQFQYVLDNYIDGKISTSELRQQVDWDKRWVWSFDLYEPIFRLARQSQIKLLALNVNSEDLAIVERSGFPGLPKDRLRDYVIDAPGFASFVTRKQYSAYNDYVIRPSYELHRQMGLLQYSIDGSKLDSEMSYRNFFSGRILWDESMASNAYRWTEQNSGGLLIGLVGADHVKFVNGIPGRYSRYSPAGGGVCVSVLLNPTLIDTRPYGTVAQTAQAMSSNYPDQITLQLRYVKENVPVVPVEGYDTDQSTSSSGTEATGGVLPLADYLVIG